MSDCLFLLLGLCRVLSAPGAPGAPGAPHATYKPGLLHCSVFAFSQYFVVLVVPLVFVILFASVFY